MHTLVDFITRVKGVEYLLALLAIAVFLFLWEFMMKAKPFKRLKDVNRDDLGYVKRTWPGALISLLRLISAPFIGLFYIICLPFTFVFALGIALLNGLLKMAGRHAAFEWRPSEAYLAGKRQTRKKEHEPLENQGKSGKTV